MLYVVKMKFFYKQRKSDTYLWAILYIEIFLSTVQYSNRVPVYILILQFFRIIS